MHIKLTKANTFVLEPNKKYLAIIVGDESLWSEQQKTELNTKLAEVNMTAVFLPEGSKYKIVEKDPNNG